ncbi:MAG TPA: saccharopine dehydrogenase NADP-binding domain-containing protein [Lacipirellulaceae bacterium]|jgi:saccharopine dehydrogenase-like NADP-dependent oxidoreductase|nr:saccharopine dehydrogenase NADP-binding domain-containing protein [Lacipirellulaceae bacterium]
MHRVLVLGAGKIGRMIARFLMDSGDFDVLVGDVHEPALQRIAKLTGADVQLVDATKPADLEVALKGRDTVLSALSYHHNPAVARAALESGASYFDLTEDVATSDAVATIAENAAEGQIFMPQCGLAPGFISIVANDLINWFERVETVKMRVGALPQFPTGELKYNLTWSTDGLINEYCNPCEAIHAGKKIDVLPLEGLEHFSLDGVRYEAFNTSGGLGTLCDTLAGKVRELNYKTVRYVGHCDQMKLLVDELRLGEHREQFKEILERAVPITFQDVVVTFCTVTGWRKGMLVQKSDARKIYHQKIGDELWSAIQITTAAGICAVLDLHINDRLPSRGLVKQEQVTIEEFISNRFGEYYESQMSTKFSAGVLGEED